VKSHRGKRPRQVRRNRLVDSQRRGSYLTEELEVALGVRVWPPVDDDLAADELVPVEGIVQDDVAGVADEQCSLIRMAGLLCVDE
jgi:hypothetical protein